MSQIESVERRKRIRNYRGRRGGRSIVREEGRKEIISDREGENRVSKIDKMGE